MPTVSKTADRVMIISSDGHVAGAMRDYAPYVPLAVRDEYGAFCDEYDRQGYRNVDPKALARRIDDDGVAEWTRLVEGGRLEGRGDPQSRIDELDADGVAGEVLFPDNGALPFEMFPPLVAIARGYTRTQEQIDVGNEAYNRWLLDFVQLAPERWACMALVSFHDVDAAVARIRWAREVGFKGVLVPEFSEAKPLFHPEFDPIWRTLAELGMPANVHPGRSSTTTNHPVQVASLSSVVAQIPVLNTDVFYFGQRILYHMIWGGVLERHPELQVVFTELGSGWVVGALENMNYSYEGSYLRSDIRDSLRLRPSEYFERQCHLGSSIFSRAEISMRDRIGVDKITLGMDYPHHEGTWKDGTLNYLQATLGSVHVSVDEAAAMLGGNAARLWRLDVEALGSVMERVGPTMDEVLFEPAEDRFPRGDVKKPLGVPGT